MALKLYIHISILFIIHNSNKKGTKNYLQVNEVNNQISNVNGSHLNDNWDDAEGYYSESIRINIENYRSKLL